MSQQLNSSHGRACVRRLSGYFTVLAALLLTFALPNAAAQTACNVLYTISPQNTSAFGATLTLQNTGTTAWTSWTLTWTFANGQTVSNLWNGAETQSGANVTVTNLSYNGSVAAGATYTGLGFNGAWNGTTNAAPTSFSINGTVCGAPPAPSFTLSPSASTLAVTQGSSATDTLSVLDLNGFTGSVTLAASGLPSGVTAAFATNPTTASSVLTLTAGSTATAGTSTVTITGTSGTLTKTTTVALTVNPKTTGSFTLKPAASTLSITAGVSATDTITVTDAGGFTGAVTLAASGLPSGVTASFGANPTTGSSVLTLTSATCPAAGTSTITITGTSGTLTATTTITLAVAVPASSFTLTPSASTLSVTQGSSATDTITVTSAGCSTGSGVTLTVSGLPSGITAAFGANPTTGSSVLTLTASSTATVGTSTVTITGTSGAPTATTTIALTVKASGTGSFTLKPSASALTINLSSGGTDTITVTDVGGFTGAVTLTASGMPSGVTAALGANPTTGSSVLTLTASSTATVGASTITIQGTSTGTASGTLSATTTIALTVTATPLVQIAWISPAAGIPGSSMTIMPGVGASFAETQGSSAIYFGTTAAPVTTWAIDSVTVTVPSLAVGTVNVTAVVNGVTSNAVPFAVTSATPSPEVYTGNSTWFSALGSPYGGCGVPQANIDSQNFVALNVQNDPGNYSLTLSRPISSQYAADIGLWDNGLNCGRWVHVVMGDNCEGTNDGSQDEPFCRGGIGWVADQFTGASLDLVVADSCQDENSWCRDDPYHLDQAQSALNLYELNGVAVGDLYPNSWNNRQIVWNFEPAPNYTGDINIGFLNGANAYWSAISITHLPNGIHGVQYMLNGVWTAAVMDADLGDDYIVLPIVAGGTQYEIQVTDVTGALINSGRIYSFTYPTSCGTSCSPALTPIPFTTSQ